MTVRSDFFTQAEGQAVGVENAAAKGDVLLVCEHASATIPEKFGTLGLSPDVLSSHAAWDPGALAVARLLSKSLDATLVYQRFSRLVYDCNRPPESHSAMPVKSEIYNIPGNLDLSEAERFARTSALYVPFHDRVSEIIAGRQAAGRRVVVVTIHSFTPVYHGQFRQVQIGILHDSDSRLADAMLAGAEGSALTVKRNDPYGPEDGVTHTLRLHALPDGLLNVMIEIRNDLITNEGEQAAIAGFLHELMGKALASIDE
ncbi:N-formylglutamate amidohydrolase [Agrobacterium tumefaciens]|uniref:N-formylglutamate amidohydrolase n=1 Tax=Agrobacterium tumefaciens TaxID=358 RepID=A0A546XZH4_AGRTU|nr:N-formylglutamate amidohydrolase [Agrobacterium tumefaciens]TRB06138.1 N-formylglutamate amidohydrolase [Agrobacterium tumefaciens]